MKVGFDEYQFRMMMAELSHQASSTRLEVANSEAERLLQENRNLRDENQRKSEIIDSQEYKIKQLERKIQVAKDPITGLALSSEEVCERLASIIEENKKLQKKI